MFKELGMILGETQIENTKLKAKNKELKRELMQYEKDVKDLNYYAIKLKQTLTDIKEIIHFNKTNRLSGGADISIAQILQKISEVEDE